jgi:hypothetical protein
MGIIGRVFGKSGGKAQATDDQLAADRARMTSARSAPLQTDEDIARVRAQMESELEAQRARRLQSAAPEA